MAEEKTGLKVRFERIADLMSVPPVMRPTQAERAVLWASLIGLVMLLATVFYIFAGSK